MSRKLLGIKSLVLILKYGTNDQKETALLTLMTTDLSQLINLRFGGFLFQRDAGRFIDQRHRSARDDRA